MNGLNNWLDPKGSGPTVDSRADGSEVTRDQAVDQMLKGLALRPRRRVRGALSGTHRSGAKGASAEFVQFREYASGDDLRRMDWRVYARTDRHFIRESEHESNLTCYVALDLSGSMSYQGERGLFSKREFAVRVAAILAAVALRRQDQVAISAFDTEVVSSLSATSSASRVGAFLDSVAQRASSSSQTGKTAPAHLSLTQTADLWTRPGQVFVLSDLFDDPQEIASALRLFVSRGHEVSVWRVLDPDEIDFPFVNEAWFDDIENGAGLRVSPSQIAESYRDAFEQEQASLTTYLARSEVEIAIGVTSVSPWEFVREQLEGRESRRPFVD